LIIKINSNNTNNKKKRIRKKSGKKMNEDEIEKKNQFYKLLHIKQIVIKKAGTKSEEKINCMLVLN
jgi:hypothetical protein